MSERDVLLIVLGGGLLAYGFTRSPASASIAPAQPYPESYPTTLPPGYSPPVSDPGGGTFPQDPVTSPPVATPPHIIMQVPVGVAKPWHLSPSERASVKQIEALRLTRYPDGSGYSIGYGHHITPGDGIGTTITQAQAEALFNSDVATVERALNSLVTVALNQDEIDALGDFIFNEGVGAFAGSTLRQKLNLSDFAGAAAEFARWHFIGTTSSAELIARRATEVAQFERGLSYG